MNSKGNFETILIAFDFTIPNYDILDFNDILNIWQVNEIKDHVKENLLHIKNRNIEAVPENKLNELKRRKLIVKE